MHKQVHYLLHLLNTCTNMSFDFVRLLLCYRAEEVPEGRREVSCFRFQNECNKVEIALRVVQFWCEIKLVITNRTPASRSGDFVITRLISDQIALHSVQLPLFIQPAPDI